MLIALLVSPPNIFCFANATNESINRRGNRDFAEGAEYVVSISFNNPLLIRFILAFVKIFFIDSRNDNDF